MMLSRSSVVLLVLVLWAAFLAAPASAARREVLESTREEILASRQRRSQQIEDILEDAKKRMASHNAGTHILSDKEKADLEKKMAIYQRKLGAMRVDLDEREIERILQREKLRNERLQQRRAQERSEL